MARTQLARFVFVLMLATAPWLLSQSSQSNEHPRLRLVAQQYKTPLGKLGKAAQRRSIPKAVHPKAPQPEPCWKVAGISPDVIARRRAIAQETQARVRQICADSSLSDQQKRQEIRRVRQAASEESQNLVTPEQRAAVKQCNQERAAAHAHPHPVARLPRPGIPRPEPHATGPCGELR